MLSNRLVNSFHLSNWLEKSWVGSFPCQKMLQLLYSPLLDFAVGSNSQRMMNNREEVRKETLTKRVEGQSLELAQAKEWNQMVLDQH